ncbi:hypothetical protein RRG08_004276 [Elysia crispata]|uniref:Uncharacterized protein n=1 Tax=Elysia crispata TaxID=231223 RepID=A0AAE0ZFY9_9GAST|nr:hypothetical protein RRG08_004276 [Elysia crispata]
MTSDIVLGLLSSRCVCVCRPVLAPVTSPDNVLGLLSSRCVWRPVLAPVTSSDIVLCLVFCHLGVCVCGDLRSPLSLVQILC